MLICLKISHGKYDKMFKLIIFKLMYAVFLQQIGTKISAYLWYFT